MDEAAPATDGGDHAVMAEKHRVARQMMNEARKNGTLLPPESHECVMCRSAPAQAWHHWHGYGAGYELDVIPVCNKCHRIADREVRTDLTMADVTQLHATRAALVEQLANGTDSGKNGRPTQYDMIRSKIVLMNGEKSYRAIADELGLGTSDVALMSRIARGESISPATLRRIGRALGVLPQPRKLVRRCMSPDLAQAWDRLTPEEKKERLA